MKFNSLILLRKINVFGYLLFTFFLNSCTSLPSEEPQEVKDSDSYALESKISGKSLMINSSELLEVEGISGFVWSPFILPLQNFTQTNAALFLGMLENSNNIPKTSQIDSVNGNYDNVLIAPPKEGECTLLVDAPVLDTGEQANQAPISTQKKLYTFVNKAKQKRLNPALFFILDGSTHKPIAVGRLNTSGKSKCFLPAKPYSLTMGYGRYRREVHIDGKSRLVEVEFPKVSSLRVRPNIAATNLKTGDTIRIGRKFNLNFTNQINSEFPEIHMGAKIQPDLYVNADMGSHDFSVDEFLKTSFLVGKSRFQIELEPGNYVVAILRKSEVVCFNTVALKSDASYEIRCNNTIKNSEDVEYQFESENTVFDVGFRPQRLMREKSFVDWVITTPGTILLGPPLISSSVNINKTDVEEENYFSLVYKNSPQGRAQQTSYGASISESINLYQIPLKGMSKKELIEGQVPFSEYIFARSRKYLVPYFLNKTNVVHTNGAEISILEPILTNKGSLYVTNNQEFIVRILIPRWNSTRVVEMFVNGDLFKRWILERDEFNKPFSTTLKTNTFEDKNFKVKFMSHGESPLPNYLTGRENFLPYAETKEFCVSLDGKDQCK